MSLDATLTRIAQLETAFVPRPQPPAAAGAGGTAAPTGGAAIAPAATSFAGALQGAMAPTAVPATPGGGANAVVAAAEAEVGQAEQPPGSNDGPRIALYRSAVAGAAPGEPWCAYFASWAARQAGVPIGDSGQGLGYVGDIWNWAQRTGRAVPNGAGVTPTPGELIVFGDHHVGIVEAVRPDGSIQTIEGNYSDRVSRVIRGAGEATGYVRLGP